MVNLELFKSTDEKAQVKPTKITPIEVTIPPSRSIDTKATRMIDNKNRKLIV